MKEIQKILEEIGSFGAEKKAILATVIDVVGSGYRRPGARMLIDENGYSIGTVSGGCLEADVLERAKKVFETGVPVVITYDTTADENSVFGLSMGCRGIVRILLERIAGNNNLLSIWKTAHFKRRQQFVGTLVTASGETAIGGRISFGTDGKFDFENFPEALKASAKLQNDVENFFIADRATEIREYQIGERSFEVFFENVNPPLNLLLFGAGYDALPLVRFAKEIGWRVSVVDHRAAFADAQRLSEADDVIVSNSEDLPARFFQDENSIAVIMTHNYERDRNILRRLMHSKCRYIGALGPKKRTQKLLAEIGEDFTAEQLEKLYAPVGLDIGANTPEAIALSITAEIQAVLAGRAGGFLRHRAGSIYGRGLTMSQ